MHLGCLASQHPRIAREANRTQEAHAVERPLYEWHVQLGGIL